MTSDDDGDDEDDANSYVSVSCCGCWCSYVCCCALQLVNYKKQLEKQQRNSEIEEERNRTEFAARFATSLR